MFVRVVCCFVFDALRSLIDVCCLDLIDICLLFVGCCVICLWFVDSGLFLSVGVCC